MEKSKGYLPKCGSAQRFDVGFSAFYLNRTNRSGILINGGPIGGLGQRGKWKIDARFNRATMIDRVQRVAAYRDRITVSNLDGLTFLRRIEVDFRERPPFVYLDPPYYVKGADLYLSTYRHEDHLEIARVLSNYEHPYWALTYDDVRPIRRIYSR